jgi:methionyl-tRNA formyltransferase
MTRVVFMGTPEFAVPTLRVLLDTQEVVGVVTQPDRPAGRGRQLRRSPIKLLALEAGAPLYQPGSLRSEEAARPLADWRPEVIVVAAFGQILRPHVLDLPPLGCVNVHASLLPRWRGAAPIQHAILAGDAETGISLMKMEAGLDTGPVYAQEAIGIGPDDSAGEVHDRLAALAAEMVGRRLDDIAAGRAPPQAQDDALATYAPMVRREDGRLDWTEPAESIHRRIRAMTPWPGAHTTWQGATLKITAARLLPDTHLPGTMPGMVLAHAGGAAVATRRGSLLLVEVNLEGRRAMSTADFLRGHPGFLGARLL